MKHREKKKTDILKINQAPEMWTTTNNVIYIKERKEGGCNIYIIEERGEGKKV